MKTPASLLLTLLITPFLSAMEITESQNFDDLLQAVVRIDCRAHQYHNGYAQALSSQGSGVLISKEGHILTNAHVTHQKPHQVKITLHNSESVDGHMVAWDPWTDLAIIQINNNEFSPPYQLKYGTIAQEDTLKLTDPVLAVGTPFGLSRTVTNGVISNTATKMNYHLLGAYPTGLSYNFLQTDAAINSGNSGGPLVTPNGTIVGINASKISAGESLGFAIPSTIIKQVIPYLLNGQSVPRSYLGIRAKALKDIDFFEGPNLRGLLIEHTDLGSPAQTAGIQAGDIITHINNEPLDGRFPEQLGPIMNQLTRTPIGNTLSIDFIRANQTHNTSLTTEPLEEKTGQEIVLNQWGIVLQPINRIDKRKKQLGDATHYEVIGIRRNYPADRSGLLTGDTVSLINNHELSTTSELESFYQENLNLNTSILIHGKRDLNQVIWVLKK